MKIQNNNCQYYFMTTANENSLFCTVESIRDILEEAIPAFYVTGWSTIFDGEAIIKKKP